MLTEILIFIFALFSLYLSYKYAVARPKGFPPGPPRMPLFGSYLIMMLSNFKYMHKAVWNFSKWYKSDIVGFYFGDFPVATVHNAIGVREVLNNMDFDGRPGVFLAAMRDPNFNLNGIFFMEGPIWKEQRRFILRHLRDFGFGCRSKELELIIQEEINDLLNLIRNGTKYDHEKEFFDSNGYRILLPYAFNPFSLNSVFQIMLNERVDRAEQSEMYKLIKYGFEFQRGGDDYGKMLSAIPWVRYIFPKWSLYNKLREANLFIYGFFSKFIKRHIETYDENYDRNFIDLYIKMMKKEENLVENVESSFKCEQFIMAMIDFTFPSFTAVGVEVSFIIQFLMLHPDCMKRIQNEIDEIVGRGRLPTLDDRKYLHYTEAAIREGLRLETLVPSSVPHKALVDTELLGYKIPKDTIVVPSLYAYHLDERIWEDPLKYRPERFLDEQGRFCVKKDFSLPFGAGKRLCAGETFARNILFLIVSALCQNFNFVLAPGDTLPDMSTNLSGLIVTPKNVWLQLEERSKL